MKKVLREGWGFFYLVLVSAVSFGQLMRTSHSGHYDFFRASALKIWAGENPYAILYPSGYFLYSPSAALFFYGAVAWLPYWTGLAIYMLASWAVLFWGARRFLRALALNSSDKNLFYFLLSSEVIGTLLNARIEIFILGIVLGAGAWLLQQRREGLAYFLLAMVCNFKMQSFPTVGLLLMVAVWGLGHWRGVGVFLASLVFWYALPYAVRPAEFITTCYQTWTQFFGPYIGASWLDFQHLFRFVYKLTGWAPSFSAFQKMSAAIGGLFALALAARIYRDKQKKLSSAALKRLAWGWNFRALALGAGFICLFSPMSQSAGFVLYAPLLALVIYFRRHENYFSYRTWTFLLGIAFFMISIAYSDLVPKDLRGLFFDHATKAGGVTLLTGAVFMEVLGRSERVS